jgi:TPR repeat protein
MMWLSQTLLQGKEVPADLPNGLRWLERSAELGNYWAMGDLAHLLDEGWYGLPRDPQRALNLKRKLAALGDTEAIGWLRFHSPEDAP